MGFAMYTLKNDHDTDFFLRGLESLDIQLSDEQIHQFLTFYEMLIKKNKVMNLTAITDFEDVVVKHFLDSLCISRVLNLTSCMSVIDLGTGAGFPGIPLKIAYPEIHITLADSLNKRILFLNDVINELSLEKISTVHSRAEEMGRDKKYREHFDICVSRAVANLSVLCEYCLPLIKEGGFFISYKSADYEHETEQAERAIQILGGKIECTEVFQIPDSAVRRSLIKIKKVKQTPKAYPRRPGIPGKNPL